MVDTCWHNLFQEIRQLLLCLKFVLWSEVAYARNLPNELSKLMSSIDQSINAICTLITKTAYFHILTQCR